MPDNNDSGNGVVLSPFQYASRPGAAYLEWVSMDHTGCSCRSCYDLQMAERAERSAPIGIVYDTPETPVRQRKAYSSPRIWVGKDNVKRNVRDMSDAFLTRLLKRLWREAENGLLGDYAGRGRVAIDECQWTDFANAYCTNERKMMYLKEKYPTFRALISAANKRGIEWAEDEDTQGLTTDTTPVVVDETLGRGLTFSMANVNFNVNFTD